MYEHFLEIKLHEEIEIIRRKERKHKINILTRKKQTEKDFYLDIGN